MEIVLLHNYGETMYYSHAVAVAAAAVVVVVVVAGICSPAQS